jgi:N-acetylneuraminic acid mutarotase
VNRRAFIATAGTLPWAIAGCVHRPRPHRQWTRLAPLPNVLGVAAPFAGVSGGTLLVAGGANFPDGFPWVGGRKAWHDVVYQLAVPDGQWQAVGKLPRPLAYGVSVSTPQGLVCVGGSDAARHYPGAFRLFVSGGLLRVEPLPVLPAPLANAAGALVGTRILVCGGSAEPGEQSALNRLWTLNLSRLSAGWRELEPLPADPRFLSIATSDAEDFILFGGVGLALREGKPARVYLRDAWGYRLGAGWRRLADLPHPLAAVPSPAPVVGGEILLMPGDDGSRFGFQPAENHPGFPRRMLAYNLQRNSWRDAAEAPFAHVTTPCVEWRGRFVVPSGEIRPGVRSPEVWSLMLR